MAREVNQERLVKDARRVLENHFWIRDLDILELYERIHDDHDGTYEGSIGVSFSEDGDAWLDTQRNHHGGALRFRNSFGGGMSPRVRNALMILALAIKLDNEERPQLRYVDA